LGCSQGELGIGFSLLILKMKTKLIKKLRLFWVIPTPLEVLPYTEVLLAPADRMSNKKPIRFWHQEPAPTLVPSPS
jgi:hypothetical protein